MWAQWQVQCKAMHGCCQVWMRVPGMKYLRSPTPMVVEMVIPQSRKLVSSNPAGKQFDSLLEVWLQDAILRCQHTYFIYVHAVRSCSQVTLKNLQTNCQCGVDCVMEYWRQKVLTSNKTPPCSSSVQFCKVFIFQAKKWTSFSYWTLATNCNGIWTGKRRSDGLHPKPIILRQLTQRTIGSFIYNRQHTRVGIIASAADRVERTAVVYRLVQNQNPNALVNIVRKMDTSLRRTVIDWLVRLACAAQASGSGILMPCLPNSDSEQRLPCLLHIWGRAVHS